jgi:hypothetical protein
MAHRLPNKVYGFLLRACRVEAISRKDKDNMLTSLLQPHQADWMMFAGCGDLAKQHEQQMLE